MNTSVITTKEESIEPGDWEELKELGHRMVDEMLDHIRGSRERKAWIKPPASSKEFLQEPLPILPTGTEKIYEQFVEHNTSI